MKILFSITYYDPYISGLSLYVKRLACSLGERSHSVCVLCMRHEASLARSEGRGNVRVMRATPWVKMSKGFLSFDFIRHAYKEVRIADVVVVNLPQFEAIIPAVFARLYGKKLIAVYHCEVLLPYGFWNRIVQKILETSNMLTLFLAKHVVTYTKDFAKNSMLLKRLHVLSVYPPIPKPDTNLPIERTLKKQIGTADVTIGVAARLAAEKGLEYLFEAIPAILSKIKSKMLKIVVAGPLDPVGEVAYKKKIMTVVAKYRANIVFLGALSEEHMGSFYRLLDVLVLPSVNSTESFGMVQVEAMMTGVPVIATDLPGVRVPVGVTGMGIIVPPRDGDTLAAAIGEVLRNRRRYKKPEQSIAQVFRQGATADFFEKLFV